ncbi:hypothetical protein AB0I82_11375 [Streptomyces sp. NPDC050315]|uniref:hypothetical protein n=1 Tax=Streptomyces sp. NPDC050315 TaxID=3155039 RepID=UPI003414CCB8
MKSQDEKRARQKTTEVKRALDDLRRRGKISPSEVQPVLARLAAPTRLSVTELNSTGTDKTEGSTYGIWIGDTACVTGAVSTDRVWVDVNGHYLGERLPAPAPHSLREPTGRLAASSADASRLFEQPDPAFDPVPVLVAVAVEVGRAATWPRFSGMVCAICRRRR